MSNTRKPAEPSYIEVVPGTREVGVIYRVALVLDGSYYETEVTVRPDGREAPVTSTELIRPEVQPDAATRERLVKAAASRGVIAWHDHHQDKD